MGIGHLVHGFQDLDDLMFAELALRLKALDVCHQIESGFKVRLGFRRCF